MTRSRISRLALLLAVLLLVGTTVRVEVSPAAASAATAVTWSVDHKAKTITVTANLAFFVAPPAESEYQKQRLEATVARAKAAIEKAWNGHAFKCYALIVKVNARAVSGQDGTHDNEVPVKLDLGVYPAKDSAKVDRSRSHVTTTKGGDDYLSDSAQFTPLTGPDAKRPSDWSFEAPDGVFAHEFGHILGLSDNYVEGTWELKPGAADDLMNTSGDPVSDATITKAVRRSGQIDEKAIKCPLRIDLSTATIGLPGFAGGTVGLHGCAPDYEPDSTDTARPAQVTFHGTIDVSADALSAVPYLGSAAASGAVDFQATWSYPSDMLMIDLGGDQIVQEVEASGTGLVSLPQPAYIKAPGAQLGLGGVMTITPYEGPCQ